MHTRDLDEFFFRIRWASCFNGKLNSNRDENHQIFRQSVNKFDDEFNSRKKVENFGGTHCVSNYFAMLQLWKGQSRNEKERGKKPEPKLNEKESHPPFNLLKQFGRKRQTAYGDLHVKQEKEKVFLPFEFVQCENCVSFLQMGREVKWVKINDDWNWLTFNLCNKV